MRSLGILFILIIVASCGKQSKSKSGNSTCDGGQCESVTREQNMDRPAQLLESKIETGIKLTDKEIVFLQDASEFVETENTNCTMEVKAGDRYQYALHGDKLEIIKSDGKKMTMNRMSNLDGSINASWAWRGYEGDVYQVVQYTFIGGSRVIMRMHCEN